MSRRRADTPSFHARRSASRSPRKSRRHGDAATAQGSPTGAGRAATNGRDVATPTVISGFAKKRGRWIRAESELSRSARAIASRWLDSHQAACARMAVEASSREGGNTGSGATRPRAPVDDGDLYARATQAGDGDEESARHDRALQAHDDDVANGCPRARGCAHTGRRHPPVRRRAAPTSGRGGDAGATRRPVHTGALPHGGARGTPLCLRVPVHGVPCMNICDHMRTDSTGRVAA
jgi:hypothetical protein